jgi:small subunit ribosomal protein S5
MAELLDEASHLESTTVGVFRTAATVKGGRRFSFSSLVVVGDRNGRVGYGYGKSNEVPTAIEKAQKAAKRNMVDIKLEGKTIPHEVEGRYLASKVRLLPASPGTGVVAGSKVRSVLELAGITDCMTKCYGSTNAINTVKAVFDGLKALRTAQEVAELRGVKLGTTDIQERIAKGSRFMQAVPAGKREIETESTDEAQGGDNR